MIKHYFETRRQFPRLKTNIPAIVSSRTGLDFPAIIQDISPDGVQITYKGKEDALLYDKSANYEVLKKLLINLKFDLPYANHEKIAIKGRPVHHHHLGNDMYVVGVIFDENDTEQKNKIMDYLVYETEPDLEELKDIYKIEKINISTHDRTEKKAENKNTLNKKNKLIKDNKDTDTTDRKFDVKHELTRMNTMLSSLITSLKSIEDTLARLERKLSK